MITNPDLMTLIAREKQRELWHARAHRLPSLRVRLACRLRGMADVLDAQDR
ncbi:MAG TPA: hypothetical protein VG245_11575 [Candidatus Dormibacteraeota bacterium]|jgi:hypothetical protein|nr:hypothetical protein [Candidatus Dormibacteraeota bacterium]